MIEGGYKIRNQSATHFLTFTVVEWIDIFTRQLYRDIILDSFRHCQAERGLLVHCWCITSNHLHFIATAKNSDFLPSRVKFKVSQASLGSLSFQIPGNMDSPTRRHTRRKIPV